MRLLARRYMQDLHPLAGLARIGNPAQRMRSVLCAWCSELRTMHTCACSVRTYAYPCSAVLAVLFHTLLMLLHLSQSITKHHLLPTGVLTRVWPASRISLPQVTNKRVCFAAGLAAAVGVLQPADVPPLNRL
jgi:hypothetical protein